MLILKWLIFLLGHYAVFQHQSKNLNQEAELILVIKYPRLNPSNYTIIAVLFNLN